MASDGRVAIHPDKIAAHWMEKRYTTADVCARPCLAKTTDVIVPELVCTVKLFLSKHLSSPGRWDLPRKPYILHLSVSINNHFHFCRYSTTTICMCHCTIFRPVTYQSTPTILYAYDISILIATQFCHWPSALADTYYLCERWAHGAHTILSCRGIIHSLPFFTKSHFP
jgi:hypothetical protein